MSEEQIQPPKEEAKASDDTPRAVDKPPLALNTTSQIQLKENPDATNANCRTRKPKPLSHFELWTIILGGIGILVAAGTGAAIVWQDIIANASLRELRKQFPELQKSTKAAISASQAAQQANTDAESRFKEDSRPYIWFTTTGNGFPEYRAQTNQVVWSFHYTDYGKGPAYGIQLLQGQIKIGDGPLKTMFRRKYRSGIGSVVPPGKDDFATMISEPNITPQEFNRLLTIDHSILIQMRIDYADAGGTVYETAFCQSRLASGAIQYCEQGNYITRVPKSPN